MKSNVLYLRLAMLVFGFSYLALFVLPVFAQDGAATDIPAPATVPAAAVVIGAVVSVVVTLLKRWRFVEEHPKVMAAALSLLTSIAATYAVSKGGAWLVAQDFLVTLASAIGTHEVMLKSLSGKDDARRAARRRRTMSAFLALVLAGSSFSGAGCATRKGASVPGGDDLVNFLGSAKRGLFYADLGATTLAELQRAGVFRSNPALDEKLAKVAAGLKDFQTAGGALVEIAVTLQALDGAGKERLRPCYRRARDTVEKLREPAEELAVALAAALAHTGINLDGERIARDIRLAFVMLGTVLRAMELRLEEV